jgi:predicted RND superfamily exporter protein
MLLVIGFSVAGLTRLRFETDIMEVLPANLPSVEALKVSQKHFGNDRQVVLLLHSEGEEIDGQDVAELADHLREKLSPAKVIYKSELEENPSSFGEALAEIWRYAPPADVKRLSERLLDDAEFKAHIGGVKEEIRGSFDQEKSTMAAYDPLGFLQHPVIREFIRSEMSFQSDDGKSSILLIQNPHSTTDYHKDVIWLGEIRQAVRSWSGMEEYGLDFGLTGGPVFNAEIGAGMEEDMSGTIMLTSVMVGLLFLLVQRHPGQLLMISLLMGLSFLITLGIGGWVFGSLNLVSVGFAAILLGLIVDYGMVIARESIGGISSPGSLRREIAPGIFWAAFTTAVVFGLLTLSTFNGVRQLGGLIVIGLIAGASVMLVFTPMILAKFPSKPARLLLKAPFVGGLVARSVMGGCVLLAIGVFAVKGEPDISFNFSMVQPSSSEAAATFDKIQEKFPAWSDRNLQMIASARSWEELRDAAVEARKKLLELKAEGVVLDFQWPVEMIPDIGYEKANSDTLAKISGKREGIIRILESNGFSDNGVALDRMILESLAGEYDPSANNALSKHFLRRTPEGKCYLSGSIMVAEPVTPENIGLLSGLSSLRFNITGWSVIQAVLPPSVKRDLYVIFLPATGVLLLTLILIFRSMRDAAISIAVLLVSLALVNAFVAATGHSWNFLSAMAIPLIVGTGIDYSIHLIFALRRSGGDFDKVWNGVGKAICFCGLSTAIGFGSLLFASNEMLRSMGLLCSLGVLLTTLLSVLVVPGLWQRNRA